MTRCGLAVLVFAACGGGSGGPVCGDGALDFGEQCDDGNAIDGDGCSACIVDDLAACGDGVLDPGEACDDNNNLDGDGCSASCTVEVTGFLTAGWILKDLATNTITGCPNGFDTAVVTMTPVGGGSPFLDLYDCAAGTGTAEYPANQYDVDLEVTDASGTQTYATSLPEVVDLTTSDQTFSTTIFNDAGYFSVSWMLKGAISNNTLTCAQANAQDVTLDATVTGGVTLTSDLFDCTNGQDISVAILAGSYTVSIAATDSNQAAVGIASPLVNQVIVAPNTVTSLGTVVIPIDGQ